MAHFLFQLALVGFLFWFTLDFEVVNLNEAPTWYLMPAYFIFAVWLGLGVNGVLEIGIRLLERRSSFGSSANRLATVLPVTVVAFFVILLTVTLARPNWQELYVVSTRPLNDWRQLLRGDQAQRFVESSLPYVKPNSIIWGDWEQYTPFKYEQLINGRRPDITARNPLDRWPDKVAAAHTAGQPIYLTRKPTDLIGTPHLSMAGPLIHIGSEPDLDSPPDVTVLDAMFEGQMELIGYRAQVRPQRTPGGDLAGPILQLMLFWRVPQKVDWDYALSLRLVDQTGQEIYKQDATHPVLSSYPTTLWTPGEVVGDFYELPLPSDVIGSRLHVIPYRTAGPGQWHNLQLDDSDPIQEGIFLGPFID